MRLNDDHPPTHPPAPPHPTPPHPNPPHPPRPTPPTRPPPMHPAAITASSPHPVSAMTSKEDLDFALADMYNEGSDDEREAALQEAMAGEAALQEDLHFALAEMYENEYQSDVEGEAALHEAMAAETTPYAPPQQSASDGDTAPKPADVPPKSICVGDVVGKNIRAALVALLRNRDLDATTVVVVVVVVVVVAVVVVVIVPSSYG